MATRLITALRWKGDAFDTTVVRPQKDQAEVVEQHVINLEHEGALPDMGTPEMTAILKKAAHEVKGQICLAVPTDQVLLRIMDFPVSEADELMGMVELQVDRFSPFPIENMMVTYEVLEKQASSIRVLIAAVRTEIIENLAGTFDKAGMLPHWIDVEILGWWYLLKAGGQIESTGRQVLLVITGGAVELMVIHNGVPVILRFLGMHGGLTDDDEIEEIVDEVVYTLTALETEWGTAEKTSLQIWSLDEVSPRLVSELSRKSGLPEQTDRLDRLPPLSEGLARRAAEGEGLHLNLVPDVWHEKENTRKLRKKLLIMTAAFLVVWGAGMLAFHLGLGAQQKKALSLQAEADRVKQEAVGVRQVQKEVKALELYADRSHAVLECLREVVVHMPEDMDLTVFRFTKAKEVIIKGQISGGADPIFKFKASLDGSSIFDVIELGATPTKNIRGRGKISTFTITATLPGVDS